MSSHGLNEGLGMNTINTKYKFLSDDMSPPAAKPRLLMGLIILLYNQTKTLKVETLPLHC